jgi:hypothetical protein
MNLILLIDIEMDARQMDFKNETFDCVIDKASLDSILVLSLIN